MTCRFLDEFGLALVLLALGLQLSPVFFQLCLLFNVQGELIDEATRTMLQLYMAGWVESIQASK